MPDKFDPYREALVMETATVWPAELDDVDPHDKARLESQLHASADQARHLSYQRTHTGFCRVITVTQEDLSRLQR